MASSSESRVRPLFAWEIEQVRTVFGDALHLERVRIHEGVPWPDSIDRLGRRLKGMSPPGDRDHNAVTLGYNSYFPVRLPDVLIALGQAQDYAMGWLIHELTHAWQFQHQGWGYLVRALSAQFRLGAKAYDFGGPEVLRSCRQLGWTLSTFNLEQQGEITRTYYYARRAGQDVSAWLPYIEDIQRS